MYTGPSVSTKTQPIAAGHLSRAPNRPSGTVQPSRPADEPNEQQRCLLGGKKVERDPLIFYLQLMLKISFRVAVRSHTTLFVIVASVADSAKELHDPDRGRLFVVYGIKTIPKV